MKKPQIDLTPVMTPQNAANLKVMLGSYNIKVEDYQKVVPPLIVLLDGIMMGKFIVIRNPTVAPPGANGGTGPTGGQGHKGPAAPGQKA